MQINLVDRDGETHHLEAEIGATLMELIRDDAQAVEAVCGGCCACATCHVWLDADRVGQRATIESELLSISEHFDPSRSRLSCQITLNDSHHQMSVLVVPED